MKRQFLLTCLMAAAATAFAQLSGSVSVQGEYEPLVIETERLNVFPQGYRFELPAANLNYEYTGVVTDFRPDLLTMGVTGRLTDWPWKKRRGYADLRVGSYLDTRLKAGVYAIADSANTLLAKGEFRSTAYKDTYAVPEPKRTRVYEGNLGLHYTGFYGSSHRLDAELSGSYAGYDRHGSKEWALTAAAAYAYSFSERNSLGINLKGDFLFPHKIFRNYGVISITPAYRHTGEKLAIKAGVDLAASYDAMGMTPEKKFGALHLAPDVSVQYRINPGAGVFIQATGGVTPSTINLTEEHNPYHMPWLFSPQPVYTPLDVRGGVAIGPFYGFAASATLRYAMSRNVPLEAWLRAYPEIFGRAANLHGVALNLNVRYAFGNVVKLCFDGTYTPQKGTTGIFNGFDRPRWMLEADAEIRPIRKLGIGLGYTYRGVRNSYSWDADGKLSAFRLPDITDLNAKITYSILENLDIYCKGDNLINRRAALLPGLKSSGIVISGGVYYEF